MDQESPEQNKDLAGLPRATQKNIFTYVWIIGLRTAFSGESSTPFDGTIKFD
jgi:hypothetical protein